MHTAAFHVLSVGCLLGTSVMEIDWLGLTDAMRPNEILTITLLRGLVHGEQHCAHTVRHVSGPADFAEDRKVACTPPTRRKHWSGLPLGESRSFTKEKFKDATLYEFITRTVRALEEARKRADGDLQQ